MQFARYTSVYYLIFTSDWSIFCHNTSQNEILGQTAWRIWWTYMDPFCPTISWSPYSSLFPLYWQSSTASKPFFWTSVLAESIQEHLVQLSHPTALGFRNPRHRCLAQCWIHCPLPHCLRCHLDYASPHSSWANFRCPKCVQVHNPHHHLQDGSRFVRFGGQSIPEFALHGGPFQTRLVAHVIFPTI